MNTSSWKRAVDFIAQQSAAAQNTQAGAMANSQQLESLPLSQLSVDDSGPLKVNYGPEAPLASSMPCAPSTPDNITEGTEPYRQIIPGITNGLYFTIIANNLSHSSFPRDHEPLSDHITPELNKYLQEATERCETEDNYFEGCHKSTNTLSELQEAFLHQEADTGLHLDPTITETPESQDDDTSSTPSITNIAQNDQLSTIPEEYNEDE